MLVVAKDWERLKGDVPKAQLLPLGTKSIITIDDYLLPEEAFEFVRAARSEMYRVMALVAVRSGLRLGELRALRWSEVDFERAQVNVIRAYLLDEITLPKGNRRRDVPLPSDALMALAGWKRVAGDRELVFCRDDGTRLDHKDCEDEFKEMWFLAGLRGCRFQRSTLPVHLNSEGIEKLLTQREEKGSCEHYLYLLRRNLNWWMPLLEGRDLNDVDESDVRRLVMNDQRGPVHFRHQKLTAIRAFVRFTRGEEEPKGSRRPLGVAAKKVGTFPKGKGWHMLRHSFANLVSFWRSPSTAVELFSTTNPPNSLGNEQFACVVAKL
jgi:site-specific recombinase XerC